jgi:hypothetical protein
MEAAGVPVGILFLAGSTFCMREFEMNLVQRVMSRLGMLLLAICRVAYCWMFLIFSWPGPYVAYTNILRMERLHRVEIAGIYSNVLIAAYSIVLGITSWMIFIGKPASKRWAIAANLIIIFPFVPAIITGHWRGVLKSELQWWPAVLFGIFGIVIFCIPYRGLRLKSRIPVE